MVMPKEPPTTDPVPEVPTFTYPDPGDPTASRRVRWDVRRWLHRLNDRGLSGACEAARAMSSVLSRHGRGLFVWLLEITGASMIAAGVGFIYWPAGLIVAGVMVILIAVYGVEFPAEEAE